MTENNIDAEFVTITDRLFTGLEVGDIDQVNSCFQDNARIWHNFDNRSLTPLENAESIKRDFFEGFAKREYLEVRRHPLPSGLVQRYILRFTRADGRSFDMPTCVFLQIRDGKIYDLEEYIDLSSFTAAMT